MSKWSAANERYHAELAAWRDAQPMTERCLFCGWAVEASAGEARLAALEHRLSSHPETRLYKRGRRKVQLGNFRPAPMHEDEREEVDAEIRRRAFLNGIEL